MAPSDIWEPPEISGRLFYNSILTDSIRLEIVKEMHPSFQGSYRGQEKTESLL